MNTLKGKNIWLTGASSGIGEALAYHLNREGANLIISARRKPELERVRKLSNVHPGTVQVLTLGSG